MSLKELKDDLFQLEKDALKAGQDSQTFIRDLGKQVEAVEEEVLAAEFLVATSSVENLGTILESGARLVALSRTQFEGYIADSRETVSLFKAAHTSGDYIDALADHVGRRVNHVTGALEEAQIVITDELGKICEVSLSALESFAKLLAPEWSLPEKKPHRGTSGG